MMQIELDIQEREVIKQYAKQMLALFRRETGGGGSRNSLGADAMALAFWERLVTKMELTKDDLIRPHQVWPKRQGEH